MKKLVLLFVLLFVVIAFQAGATVLNVPTPAYPTIQAAINAAYPGDVIQVAAGTYTESLTVPINNLTIQGAGIGTKIKTIGSTPGIQLYGNNFTLKYLQITHNTQMKEGIRVYNTATTGFTMDGVYITNISNNADDAYGVNFLDSFTGFSVKNCQFAGKLSASRAMAFYAPKNALQSNWLIESSGFQYLYTGIYLNSAVNGLTVQSNNFGPWDINDCRQAASALYIGDGMGNFNISGITVTNNTFNNYARGVYFLNNVAGKVIGATTITNNVFTNSIWSSGVRLVAGTSEYGVQLPAVLEGPVYVCNNTFNQSAPIVNGSGVAMIDFRTVTGGESSSSDLTVCSNTINFSGSYTLSTWGLLLRGPFSHANITGNTFSGNMTGGASPDMPPTSAVCIQTNYYNYGTMNSNAQYLFTNNVITGFTNGIAVYDMLNKVYGGIPGSATVKATNNQIYGNTVAINSGAGARTNARNNYWGTNTGPYHSSNPTGTGNPVTDYVDFLPWWCDASMSSICPTPGPTDAILNIDTYTWYPKTALGTACTAALNGHTLYIVPGTVYGGITFNYPGKTVNIIGSGRVGQSVICGPGRSMTITSGTVNFGNGLTLTTSNPGGGSTAYKNLWVQGSGIVKVRDCMLVEDPSSPQSIIEVTGGGLADLGSLSSPGHNLFVVQGTGFGVYNTQYVTLPAYGNDWGSTKGPKISTNPGGNGAQIWGSGMSYVQYNPWRAGPVTVASRVKACNGATSVEIPVKVASFTDVGGIALQLSYDPSKLTNPVMSYQDAAFSQWGYLQMNTSVPGTITISANSSWPQSGLTFSDSTTIFMLTFNLVPGTLYASLNFIENTDGSSCQYTGAAPYFMKFGDMPQATHYINGSVTYSTSPASPVSVTIAASATVVEPGNTVTFTATPVNGGSNPAYAWKVNGTTVSTTSGTYTYIPSYGDEVKCVLTSNEQCVTGNPATSNSITIYVLQFNVNSTGVVANGEIKCFNAGENLTVGGLPSTFLVETGGNATLIAGKKIRLLPGTTIQYGAYVHAYIAPNGPFCAPPVSSPQITGNQNPNAGVSGDVHYKVFPNPTDGDFTVIRSDDESFNNVKMAVYTMEGRQLLSKDLNGQRDYTISAKQYQTGIYFIRFMTKEGIETVKLVKAK